LARIVLEESETYSEMAKKLFGEEDSRCAGILTLVANCYVKMKEYDTALEYMGKVWEIS